MKIKFSQILPFMAILMFTLVSFVSVAQDEGQSPVELQDNNHLDNNQGDEDKAVLYEHDSKPSKNTSSETHQSTVITPVKSKNADSHKQATSPNSSATNTKDGDDALSFNFLFYIIQKYKFSDIVDQ